MRRLLVPLAALALASCSKASVRPGSTVKLFYTAFVDGAAYDSNEGSDGIRITQGRRELVPGLDDGLLGMKTGETKDILVPPERGYGERDPKAIESMPLKDFGELAARLSPGATVHGMRGGKAAEAKVVSVENGKAVLDFNHPLAGKTVRFRVRVAEIR